MPIALFSDLLSIVTLHIHSFYMASARIFNWQYTILLSLFQLFRGKKHNVLRKRIDSCDYDLDQLLLGTILFTLLFFLLPTVIVFYLTFACSRMAIISLKAVLDTMLACLNHFPLFALMLRIKDSRRLPGGIRFELRDTRPSTSPSPDSPNPPPTSYIYLKVILRHRRHFFLLVTNNFCSLSHSLSAPCSINTSNLVSASANTIYPRESSSASQRASLCRLSIAKTSTACSIACSLRAVRILEVCGMR